MAHLSQIDIDSEYGFLSYLIRWLDSNATIQFGKSGADYRCLMTYEGVSHEASNPSLFGSLKIVTGKHSTDTLYLPKKEL